MNIVSKIRTVSKLTEEVHKELATVEAPDTVVSKVDFISADKSVHEFTRLNNKLKAVIEVAKEPFLKEIKKIDTEVKPTKDALAEGIENIKGLMTNFFDRYPNTELEAGTVMAIVKDVKITDIKKVPTEYYEISNGKILEAWKNNVKVPGTRIVEKYQIRITEKKY